MATKSVEPPTDEREKLQEDLNEHSPVDEAEKPTRTQPTPEKASASEGNWSDYEILTEAQDRFSFQDYANVLASPAAKANPPLTIGIFGRWGSGKTSLMKLIEAALTEEKKGIVSKLVFLVILLQTECQNAKK